MDCRSFDYALVRPYAAVVIVLYGIAAPVVVWSLLARFRLPIENAISAGTLGLESTKGAGANKKPRILLEKEMLAALHRGIKASSVLKGTALKCLFRYTKPECWWFEVADIARRLCITSVSLLFEGSQKLLFFGILVTSFCLVVHREVQPYLEPSLNVIKYFEHWLTMLCLVVLLGKDADMFGAYPRIPYAFGASVLYVTHLAMGAFMIRSIFNRAIQERLDHTAMVQQEINERFTLEGSSSTDRRTTQARAAARGHIPRKGSWALCSGVTHIACPVCGIAHVRARTEQRPSRTSFCPQGHLNFVGALTSRTPIHCVYATALSRTRRLQRRLRQLAAPLRSAVPPPGAPFVSADVDYFEINEAFSVVSVANNQSSSRAGSDDVAPSDTFAVVHTDLRADAKPNACARANADGVADTSELVAEGTYTTDNGSVTFTFNEALLITTEASQVLITYEL